MQDSDNQKEHELAVFRKQMQQLSGGETGLLHQLGELEARDQVLIQQIERQQLSVHQAEQGEIITKRQNEDLIEQLERLTQSALTEQGYLIQTRDELGQACADLQVMTHKMQILEQQQMHELAHIDSVKDLEIDQANSAAAVSHAVTQAAQRQTEDVRAEQIRQSHVIAELEGSGRQLHDELAAAHSEVAVLYAAKTQAILHAELLESQLEQQTEQERAR